MKKEVNLDANHPIHKAIEDAINNNNYELKDFTIKKPLDGICFEQCRFVPRKNEPGKYDMICETICP